MTRASALVRTLAVCAAIQQLGAIHQLGAQAPQPIAAGTRVRVTAPAAGLVRVAGRVESLSRDSLVLVPDSAIGSVRLATSALSSLEVSRGRRRHIAAGVALGYALMFGLGLAGHPGMDHTDAAPFAEAIGYGIVYGTPVALAGGIIGGSIRTERWDRVQLPAPAP